MAIKLIFLLLLFNFPPINGDKSPCPKPTNFGGLVGEFEKIINGDGDIVSFGWAYYEFATSLWEFIPEIGGAMSSVAHAVVSPPPEYAECLNAIYELIEKSTQRILDAIENLKHTLLKAGLERDVYNDIATPIAKYNDMFKHMLKINDTTYDHVYDTVVGDCKNSNDGYMALMRAFEARFYLNCANKNYGSVSNQHYFGNESYALVPTKNYGPVANKSYEDKEDYSCYPSAMKNHYKDQPAALHKIAQLIIKQSIQVSLIVSVCLNITNVDPEKNIKDINNAFEENVKRLTTVNSYVTKQLLGQEGGSLEELKKDAIYYINAMDPANADSIAHHFSELNLWAKSHYKAFLPFYMYRFVLISDSYEDYLMVCPNISCIFVSPRDTNNGFSMLITQTMVDRQPHYAPVVKEYAEKRYQTLSVLQEMYGHGDKMDMHSDVLNELNKKSTVYMPWRGYFSGLFIFKLNKKTEDLRYHSMEIDDIDMGIIEQPYVIKKKPRYIEFALF